MTLPASDHAYLGERGAAFTVSHEAGMTCVVLSGYELPEGFNRAQADLLLRLNAGYPDVPPDMWWFEPAVLRADGVVIPNTDVYEMYLGRRWQRWSRHLSAGQWLPGRDSLESFLALVASDLRKSVPEMVQ